MLCDCLKRKEQSTTSICPYLGTCIYALAYANIYTCIPVYNMEYCTYMPVFHRTQNDWLNEGLFKAEVNKMISQLRTNNVLWKQEQQKAPSPAIAKKEEDDWFMHYE